MKKNISLALLTGALIFNEKIIVAQETLPSNTYFSLGKETFSTAQKILKIKTDRFNSNNADQIKIFINQKIRIESIDGVSFPLGLSSFILMNGDKISTDINGYCQITLHGAILHVAENTSLEIKLIKNQIIFYLTKGAIKLDMKNFSGNNEVIVETKDIFTYNQADNLILSHAPNKGTTIFGLNKPTQFYLKSDMTKTFTIKNKDGFFVHAIDVKRKKFDRSISKQVSQLFRETEEIKFISQTDYETKVNDCLIESKFTLAKEYDKNETKLIETLKSHSIADELDYAELIYVSKSYLKQFKTTSKKEQIASNIKTQKVEENKIPTSEEKQSNNSNSSEEKADLLEQYKEKLKEAELLRLEEERHRREALEADLKAHSIK